MLGRYDEAIECGLRAREVFLAHGVLDKVLPVRNAREAKSYLGGLDVSLTYNEYDMPHTISAEEANALIEWLLRVNR